MQESDGMFEHFRLEVDPGQAPLRIDKKVFYLEDATKEKSLDSTE